ncbi:MAG: Sensor histidine kinase RcsC [Chlamydiales bacterium]|nr:Sensor histidine kinase RcsC [Chlamydiales bacterium]MCH9619861.1 Sensor histidine kinase RcsC [Chlamydiales bacterium]MCH9622712.1 Sensor histidine kinase RcsC [Chlamydiales bacterium]
MKIFPKLLCWFLIISIIPIIVLYFISYRIAYNETIGFEIEKLNEIAKGRINSIAKLFEDLEGESNVMTRSLDVIGSFQNLEEKKPLNPTFVPFISSFKNFNQLSNVYLISKEGELLYALNEEADFGTNLLTGPYKESVLSKAFRNTLLLLGTYTSEYTHYEPSGKPVIFISSPVYREGKLIGVFAFQIPFETINQIFEDYTSLEETGEILVGIKKENKILFINEIRHKSNSAFKFTVPFDEPIAFPIKAATQGISGKGVSVDYRGESIIGVWNTFPYLHSGVVIKMDLKESLAPLNKLLKITILIGVLLLILVIFCAYFISRSISRPIIQLEKDIRIVGEGDLDHRTEIKTKNELGHLSRVFDQTVIKLKDSIFSIDRLNKEIEMRKKAEETKAAFYSMASHELRGPITPIIQGIDLILEGEVGEISEAQRKILESSSKSAHKLILFINDLLNLQQIESGKVNYSMEMYSINPLIEECVNMFEISAKTKGLELQVDLQPDLPQTLFDEVRITEVLTNLINNAIKFSEQGTITISSSKKEGFLIVKVKDEGPGIAEENIPKLFKNYSRFNRGKPGSGLGLAICKEILHSHNGTIWAESTEGEGTSFIFKLPMTTET